MNRKLAVEALERRDFLACVGPTALVDPVLDSVAVEIASEIGGTNNDDLNTPADVIHPNIHRNNGPGNNANPNGSNAGGGNMHGIGNNPGKSGRHPNADGVKGFSNQLTDVHGGIDSKNKNAQPT